ncbi:MAG: hypothetical protein ACP5NL_01765 [Thermoplasmata archaeon]
MRKKILIVGIVLLIVGIVIYGASAMATANETTNSHVWVAYNNGEYISKPLNFTGQNVLTYFYSASESGVIPASDLSTVNSNNLGSLAISPNSTVSSEKVYDLSSGTYYIVIFSNHPPSANYIYLKISNILLTAILTLVGVIVFIAGIIIAIIGAVLKKKNRELDVHNN